MKKEIKITNIGSDVNDDGSLNAEVEITTKEAFGVITGNVKEGLNKTWQKVKPKLKVAAGVAAIGGAAIYFYNQVNGSSDGTVLGMEPNPNLIDIPTEDIKVSESEADQSMLENDIPDSEA